MGDNELSNNELFTKLMQVIKTEGVENKNLLTQIKNDNKILLDKLNENSVKLKDLEIKHQHVLNRCLYFERSLRKNNIFIYGLHVSDTEDLLTYIITKFKELLDVDVTKQDINNIFTLNSDNTPPIKVELTTYIKKREILQNCNKLKGKNVYINNDLCKEDREDQKILIENLKAARAKQYSAHIKGKVLVVSGVEYTLTTLKEFKVSGNFPITNTSPTSSQNVPQLSENLQSPPILENNNSSQVISGKRGNSSPADSVAEKEKTKLLRSNSSSSSKSDNSSRSTRSTVKK